MTTRQRYKRILEIIEGISKVQKAAARAEAARNRDDISIFTKAYTSLLLDAMRVDPKSQHVRVLDGSK